jgi:signal transduction histidine kinase
MSGLNESRQEHPFGAPIPPGIASLESVLCTDELRRRPWRTPDYEKENRALVALVSSLADAPRTILQTLADKILAIFQCESAGLSLLTKDSERFYWPAIAGAWQPHIGGGTPRDFGPCGDVLDLNAPLLFRHFEERYPYFRPVTPLVEECLLVPFYVDGIAVGTIWAITHTDSRRFDTEDLRLLESMGRFASAAYQAVESIEVFKSEVAARDKAENELRELTAGLEQQVQARTEALGKARSELAHVARVTSLGALTASIAHEVNQPIGASRNNAHAALRFLAADPLDLAEVREALESVVSETYRAAEILSRIRDQVKKAPPRMEGVTLNAAIEEVIALVRGELSKHRVTVRTRLAAGLSPVYADRVQLQQVVLNLILNAIEAITSIDDESRELVISTESSQPEGVLVAVADSGPGVNPDDRERVFESFYTTKTGGVGIGLSICRSIIDAHSGRLWVDAGQPRGAVFRFTVPVQK